MANRISGQGGVLTISGGGVSIGPLGVSRCRLKNAYTNADVTVTTSGANEEFMPIVRGKTYEIEVPFDSSISPGIEMAMESAMFPASNSIVLPTVLYQIKGGGGGIFRSYSGIGMLESYQTEDDAKDAVRVTFTVRMTGLVTIV